jgi:hypothetical protein
MRRSVALDNGRRSCCACIALYMDIHAVTSMSIAHHRILESVMRSPVPSGDQNEA